MLLRRGDSQQNTRETGKRADSFEELRQHHPAHALAAVLLRNVDPPNVSLMAALLPLPLRANMSETLLDR